MPSAQKRLMDRIDNLEQIVLLLGVALVELREEAGDNADDAKKMLDDFYAAAKSLDSRMDGSTKFRR